jgi:hypothetical protein
MVVPKQLLLAGEDDVARLTLSWRDVHDNKLVPLDVVVRLASVQMVGREGEPAFTLLFVGAWLLSDMWTAGSAQELGQL